MVSFFFIKISKKTKIISNFAQNFPESVSGGRLSYKLLRFILIWEANGAPCWTFEKKQVIWVWYVESSSDMGASYAPVATSQKAQPSAADDIHYFNCKKQFLALDEAFKTTWHKQKRLKTTAIMTAK